MGGSDHGIRLRSSAHTSIGQVRENNEDNVRLWSDDDFVVAVVADGMGGAVAGEEASRIAVEAIQEGESSPTPDETLLDLSDDQIVDWLSETIHNANTNIVHRASDNPELRGMGTTMTMAFVRSNRAIIAHVGDSRAYLVEGRSHRITQITADHSFVEALVAAGHLTHEQAEEHPMRNVLYRALGQNDEIDVDIYEARLRPGDRLILCSDGLTRHVKPGEIASLATSENDPDLASQALIDLANARGGEDNVSVIVVMLEGPQTNDDTDELKDFLLLEDTAILKDRRETRDVDTVEVEIPDEDDDDTLKMNPSGVVSYAASTATAETTAETSVETSVETSAAPTNDGRDTRVPEQ